MTDNDIIKALECCLEGKSESCLKCVFRLTPYPACKTLVEKHALDLINRQKAEIEHTNQLLEAAAAGQETLQKHMKSLIAEIFAEIEKIINEPFAVGFDLLLPLKKALDNYNNGIRKDLLYYIAELKEKYTGVNDENNS